MTCNKCHGSGLVRNDNIWLAWCDCAVGRVVWQAALERALGDVAQEVGAQ